MSTQSMLLLCTGAAASLAGVWSLAGLSESSPLRSSPRVIGAVGAGLVGALVVYQRTPQELRGELLLPGLFAVASVLALAAGAAKLEAALAERDGPRAVRRASGLVIGTYWGMVAVGTASLELVLSSLSHARLGWSYMLPLVAAVLVVFANRVRLAGAGAILLGRRGLTLVVVGIALLCSARAVVQPASASAATEPQPAPSAELPSPAEPVLAAAPSESVAAPSSAQPDSVAPAPSAAPVNSALAPAPSAAPADSAVAPALGAPGELVVEKLEAHGMLEADARGGVQRRFDKLQACLAHPKNQQRGALSLKIGIDAGGSVTYSRALTGDLLGTPLATCLLPVFYKMGFAAPSADNAYFEITLRTPS
jgi:hypothetical protein